MNISIENFRLTHNNIYDLKSNESKHVPNLPNAQTFASMPYNKMLRKVRIAFETGKWPMTEVTCQHCGATSYVS